VLVTKSAIYVADSRKNLLTDTKSGLFVAVIKLFIIRFVYWN
jgi:hypothetical protein